MDKRELSETFRKRLGQVVQRSGDTHAQFARDAGIDRSALSQLLTGRAVRLPGFVVPLDETPAGLTSFLLVPYFGACIHTPPPPANQIVHVHAKTPVKSRTMDAVWVRGTLKIERAASSMGTSGYRLDAVGVEPYVEKR